MPGEVPDRRDPIVLGALAWLRAEAAARRAGWPRVAVFASLVAMMALFALIASALVLTRRAGLPPYSIFLIMPVGVLLMILAGSWIVGALTARALAPTADLVRDAILRMRRCASCGYALGADPANEGEVVCPECGAAWAARSLGRLGVAQAGAEQAMAMRHIMHTAAGHRTRRRDAAGRPYGPVTLAQRRESDQRWRDILWARARRVELAAFAMLAASFAVAVAVVVGDELHAARAFVVLLTPTIGVVSLVAIFALVRRRLDRERIRVRRCLACEYRLRRHGDLQRCDACDAVWPRPTRGRDTLRR